MKPARVSPPVAWRDSTTLSDRREAGRGRVAVALLGHEGRAAPAAGRDALECPTGAPSMRDRPGPAAPGVSPDRAAKSSAWPLPATPGDAQDLAAPHGEVDVAQRRAVQVRGGQRQAAQPRSARPRRTWRRRGFTSPICAPDHQGRDRAGASRRAGRRSPRPCRRAGWWRGRTGAAPPRAGARCRAAPGPRPCSRSSVANRRFGLLRRQHRGRLVEDQQLRVLQQAARDLDALALAGRQRPDRPVRLEHAGRSAPTRRRCARRAAPRRLALGSTSAMFSATVRFSNSEKCWNTMPMPSAAGGLGAGERHRPRPASRISPSVGSSRP